MNVVGYVRVSSDAQVENYSIPQQKKAIESYCKAKGWELIKIYCDGGFTGANMNRPALQELLKNIDLYDMVLVFKLDRLSRKQKDTLELIEVFSEHNTKFASIRENFDTSTALGVAMVGILSTFAQLEREQIKERMALGKKGRTEKGLWRAGSNVPTGYDYIDGHLVIREDEAVQIRKIFELCLEGKSFHAIRDYMHAHYTNRYSSWAQASAISTTLRNPLYIGKLPSRVDKKAYDGEHEPIIDIDTFNRVQHLLDARSEHFDAALKHPFKATHLLTGLTYCGECGGRVSCVGTHKYSYYGCHRKWNGDPRRKKLKTCSTPNYNVKKLDALIIGEVMKLAYDEKAIKDRIKPRKKVDHRKALKSLENRKSRLIDLYSIGGINADELTIKIVTINEKIEQLKNDVPEEPELTFEDAKKIFEDAKLHLNDNFDNEQKRAILHSLIKKIVLKDDEILIYWRFE